MDLNRQRQLELEAEAEMELENETRTPAPSQRPTLGADYNDSLFGNLLKGVVDTPRAAITMAGDAYDFVNPYADVKDAMGRAIPDGGGPIDTISRAGAEKTLRTVGGLGAGVAGAAALAPFGAGWGSAFGPLGTVAGGALAGGAGFAGGLLGFDFATDAVTAPGGADIKPLGHYLKDFAYNTSQGTALAGGSEAVGAIPKVRRLAEPFTQAGQEAKVAEYINNLEPGYAGKVDEAYTQGAGDPFLDSRPLGELINSDTIKNVQRTLSRSGDPKSFNKFQERTNLRNDEQLKYLDEIEQAPFGAESVQDSIRQSIEERQAASQRGVTAAEDTVNSALSDLPAPIDVVEAGGQMREGANTGLDAQKGRVTAGFEGIGEGLVDPTPAKLVIARDLPTYFKEVGAQPNEELLKLVEDLNRQAESSGLLGPDGKPVTKEATYNIKQIQAMRSEALDIANTADPRSARIAGNIADALVASVDDAIKKGNVTPEQAASWQKGIKERKTQGQIYESSATPTKSVLSKQPYGEFKVPESAVPSKYFRPGEKGTREAIQNYKRAIGNTEEALEPLYRYATDSFKDYVVKDGKVDSTKAGRWLRRHAQSLEELPQLKRQLSNVDEAQRFLNEKYGDLQRSQVEVEKGALKQFLQVDPERAIEQMLSGKDMVKRTISTVQYLKRNDIDALAGLRRGVIEYLERKTFIPAEQGGIQEAIAGSTFNGKVLGGTLANELAKIRPALQRSGLFNDSQLKNFDTLYKERRGMQSVENAKAGGGSDTAQNISAMGALKDYAEGAFLNKMPFSPFLKSVVLPVLKTIPKVKFLKILEEANLNPRYARDLHNKASAKNVTKIASEIFKEDIAKAFGDTSAGEAATNAAKIGAPFAPVVGSDQKPKKRPIPNQSQITSKKSFPTTQQLLAPPAHGSVKKTTLNLENLSPETRARISVESNGNPYAVSAKGAQGLSQLMPATAHEIADEIDGKKDGIAQEPYMPLKAGMSAEQQQQSIQQNVRFGDFYYNKQLKRFKNPTLARAAYNAGPQRVIEAQAMAGSQTDVNKILANLPKGVKKETVPYVREIMARLGNV